MFEKNVVLDKEKKSKEKTKIRISPNINSSFSYETKQVSLNSAKKNYTSTSPAFLSRTNPTYNDTLMPIQLYERESAVLNKCKICISSFAVHLFPG